ncbi:MAG: acylphosphatase [Nitrososphaera sp.]|jgi:acylphosphatase
MASTDGKARPNAKMRAHVYVMGTVQGVYFRQNTKEVATRHGVRGWVRNLDDGRVEAVFEGDEASVNEVIEWCRVGPQKAKVEDVSVAFEKYVGEFSQFDVSY